MSYYHTMITYCLSRSFVRMHILYLRNIFRTALCWVVWHNGHSQQHTRVSSSYRSSRLGLSHWDTYAMHIGGCLELYYCNNQSINQSFYCKKAWQNAHLDKKNTVKRQWTRDNSYAYDINTRKIYTVSQKKHPRCF